MRGIPGPYPVVRRVGDVELIAIADATLVLEAAEAVAGVPIAQLCHECPEMMTPDGWWFATVTCYLVRSSGTTVMFDTGIGPRGYLDLPKGQLDIALEELGVSPGEVDIVVNSHLHFDHVGWNTVDDPEGGVRTFFPNATYLIDRREWQSIAGADLDSTDYGHLVDSVLPLKGNDQLQLVDPDHWITTELTVIATPGHTSGHSALRIESRGQFATLIGDVSHYYAQVQHSDWASVWDTDPSLASRTRQDLFASLCDQENHLIVAGHWPYPGIGHIVRTASGMAFRAD